MGDCNVKIGKEEIYKPVIGNPSKYTETNENGRKLIEFAVKKELQVATTYFQHLEIHKGTWLSLEKTVNQIDNILIGGKYLRYIIDARSYRGADADSNHFLVKAKIK